MKQKHALVLGGTGLVGKHLLQLLTQAGVRVDLVSRQKNLAAAAHMRVFHCDLADPQWLQRSGIVLSDYDVVFHLAYSTHHDDATNYRITVESVRSLVQALGGRPCHFVYVGSMAVFGNSPKDLLVNEQSERVPDSEYAQQKIEATSLALSPPPGVFSTVLHPTGVYDVESPRIEYYSKLLEYNYLPPNSGLGINNIIHAQDVASALVQCLERNTAQQAQEYIINGESIEYADWFGHLANSVGGRPLIKLPAWCAPFTRGPIRRVFNHLGIGCPLYFSNSPDNPLTRRCVYSSHKAVEDFSFTSKFKFYEVFPSTPPAHA